MGSCRLKCVNVTCFVKRVFTYCDVFLARRFAPTFVRNLYLSVVGEFLNGKSVISVYFIFAFGLFFREGDLLSIVFECFLIKNSANYGFFIFGGYFIEAARIFFL